MLVRRSLGMLCSETDGLPKKQRIVFEPDGLVREEQTEDIIHFAYDYMIPLWNRQNKRITQLIARAISLILYVEGFTQEEVYLILKNERYKK